MFISNLTSSDSIERQGRVPIAPVVFGLQDGMVSTLGAITGIAIGSGEHYIVLLAGVAIIAVESISMGIGEYVSTRSERHLAMRMHTEEEDEITTSPKAEQEELEKFFVRDGWPPEEAGRMAGIAAEEPELMLTEMAYRELGTASSIGVHPKQNGLFMFCAYIAGGLVPLASYFFLSVETALYVSVCLTLGFLFVLGAGIARYTKQSWIKNGIHLLFFGGVALGVGLVVGTGMRVVFGV